MTVSGTPVRGLAVAAAVVALAASGCASAPRADRLVYDVSEQPSPYLEAPPRVDPAPLRDIPESERIRWHEENRAPRGYSPRRESSRSAPARDDDVRVATRRVVVHESRYVPADTRCVVVRREPWDWVAPVAVTVGLGLWWHGHHHRHHRHHRHRR